MILTALDEYYRQLLRERPGSVPELGWALCKVTHLLALSPEGELVNVIPAPDKKGWTKRVPEREKRTVGIAANALCDNSSYLLGIDAKGKPERSAKCFEAARSLHLDMLAGVTSRPGLAVRRFFERWDPGTASENELVQGSGDALLAGGNLAFVIDGVDVAADEEVQAAWDAFRNRPREDDSVMRCLVTGDRAPVAALHPSIKGIAGAQSSGASLVSFNARSFESYGHTEEQGRNAPVSKRAAFSYAAALNYLISAPEHSVRIGDTTVVYWADRGDEPATHSISVLLGGRRPNEEPVKDGKAVDKSIDAIMQSLASGGLPDLEGLDPDATFYVLGIAPNAARLSVRFFYRNTFASIYENLRRHYVRIALVSGSDRLLTPYWLVKSVENPNAKNPVASSELGGALLRAIFSNSPYPRALYSNALLRVRATRDDGDKHVRRVSRERAAIVKAYLIKNIGLYEEGTMESIDEERTDVAYALGQLFWVLEDLQHLAMPKINTTINDKYFDSACTTPARVFPMLVKLSNKHLVKAKRDHVAIATAIERKRDDLLGRVIGKFPLRLSDVEQGEFILGYFHLRAEDLGERAARKKDAESSAEEE